MAASDNVSCAVPGDVHAIARMQHAMKADSFDGGDLSAMSSASRDGYSPRGAGHWQGPWMSSGKPSPYNVVYSAHGMLSATLKMPCNVRSV